MSEAVEQCKIAMQALSDWAATYASDMCDAETVAKAKQRIHQHGTLAYIANATDQLQSVITALSEAEQRKNDARESWSFAQGDYVCKKSGSWWAGRVVGFYTTEQTPRGYAVQLDKPFGPVQIYPESALERFIPSEPHDAEGWE